MNFRRETDFSERKKEFSSGYHQNNFNTRMRRNIILVFLVLAYLLFHLNGISGNNERAKARKIGLELVGQVGGPTTCVALYGGYVYLGVGLKIVVQDVSNPAVPKEVGATEAMPDFVTEVKIDGNTAFVTAGGAGLSLFDITNPSNPKRIGSYDSVGFSENICISANTAYLADGWAGIQILDISDRSNPVEISSIQTLGYAFEVTLVGQCLYVASGGAGLRVVDVSNPFTPVEISSYDTPGYSYGIASEGKKVYIADGWEGIRIVDVSNPEVPVEAGFYKTLGWAFDIDIIGNVAYVADANKGLRVVDVSNATAPTEIGHFEFSDVNSHAGKIIVGSNIAIIADRNWGMRVVDISNKFSPAQISFWGPMNYADGVAVVDHFLYVASGKNGFRIVDISAPNHPKEIGAYDTKSYATSVAVADHYAYVAMVTGGLFVIDVADASRPQKVGGCPYSAGAARDLFMNKGLVFIANEKGVDIVDVSNPLTPTLLGFIQLSEFPEGNLFSAAVGVTANGTLAYVATEQAGIKIIDISNPANPKLVSNFRDMNFSQDVAIAQSILYVADSDGLAVLDVSNPSEPQKIGFCDTPGFAESVSVDGNIALVSDGECGLWLVDVSNPRAPAIKDGYNSPGYAQEATSKGQFIYLADQEAGLIILDKTTTGLNSGNINTANKATISGGIPYKQRWNSQLGLFHSGLFHVGSYYQGQNNDKNEREPKTSNDKSVFKDLRNLQQMSISSSKAIDLIVNNISDSGPGTLRWCIENAKSGDAISFDSLTFPPSNPASIYLNSSLPSLSQGNIAIDASNAGVILNGRNLSGNSNGIYINSSGNIIRGLQIVGFPYAGIFIQNAKDNIIGGNRTFGKGLLGQGNMISGNGFNGIYISFADQNIITGNLLGTDISGVNKMGNGGGGEGSGIWIGGSSGNRIGGIEQGERNIISGNRTHGVSFIESMENSVINNYIGIDINGTSLLSNGDHGVAMELGSPGNLVKDNVIATTGRNAILINDWGSSYNVVVGNLVGTDRTGSSSFEARDWPIFISMGAGFNRIGGTNPGERNVICGSGGVVFGRQGAIGNLIIGNYIGTDITGMRSISPRGAGVGLGNGRPFIGGMTEGEKNVISGNKWNGIMVRQGVDNAWIAGNYIGVDASGANPLWNNGNAIEIGDNTGCNIVQGNLISGNKGIELKGEKNVLYRNIFLKCQGGVQGAGNDNLIYQNKIIENQTQATDSGINIWSWKNVGNFWSDYKGLDSNNDGIGDTPYTVSPNGVDKYPLIRSLNVLTLNAVPQAGGNIKKSPPKSSYEYGENVRLKAIPTNGYEFSFWAGDATGNMNPITTTMNVNRTMTAYFRLIGGENPIISGLVKTSVGTAIEGVAVSFSDGDSATTDSSGNYSKTVNYGWTGTATPSKAGYTFVPSSRSYSNVTTDQTGQDYTSSLLAYTVSGTVNVGAAAGEMAVEGGLAGVVMSGLPGNPATDATGAYTANVDHGWSGMVTPTKAGFTFTPASRSYTNVTSAQAVQDYTATAVMLTILGQVKTSGGAAIEGVAISFSDCGTTTTDASGNYSKTVSYGWTGTTTPSKAGYTFVPSSRSYTNVTSNQTGQDFTANLVVPPKIGLSRRSFNFGGSQSGQKSSSQQLIISNAGGGTLNWSITVTPVQIMNKLLNHAPVTWLSCDPMSGTSAASINLQANPSGLSSGTYSAKINVTADRAINSPQTVTVNLQVYDGSNAPIGVIDTPLDGTIGIEGSVPVTGWVVDDIEVDSVKIYRDPINGEQGGPNGYVYIGDAVFVESARPDVEQAFPNYPMNYKAGWGYMMLTNFLPNQGNGTFRIHAIATDKEGNTTLLGSKTISCDNAHAVLPFGAIDVPSQGGTASGSAYINFAWVLATKPKCIPTDGSTIWAWVDGLPIGHPSYGYYRVDIATLFPGYCNANGAIGYIPIDTTKYANGVHTIVWSATDSAGVNNGFGSRYFTIQNAGSGTQAEWIDSKIHPAEKYERELEQGNINSDPRFPFFVRKGLDREAPLEAVYPDEKGQIRIEIRELERVEITLSGEVKRGSWRGYLLVGEELRPFPVGSSFDANQGIFSWLPGEGFVGEYEFIFIGVEIGGTRKIPVKVMIRPRFE